MPPVKSTLPPALLLFSCLLVRADVVELRSGERVEGTITSVTAVSVIIDVPVSEKIRDERIIPRAEVVRLERKMPDDVAYAAIAALKIPETLSDPAPLEAMMQAEVRPFLNRFAYSRHISNVRALQRQILAEQQRLAAGEVKIEGEWIPAEAFEKNRSALTGRLLLAQMNAAMGSRDPASAMNAYDRLLREAPASESVPAAGLLARRALDSMVEALPLRAANLRREQQQREEGLKLAREDQRAVVEKALEQERQAAAQILVAAREKNQRWIPNPGDPGLVDEQLKLAREESAKVSALPLQAMQDAVQAAAAAREALGRGDLAVAETQAGQAAKLWPQLETLRPLSEDIAKAKASAEASPAASPAKP